MAKTNWTVKDSVLPNDLNVIGEEINELRNGFIKKSIVIPAGEDLNTYMEEGNYYCPANATVETLLNSPTGEAFHLAVEPHAGVLQTLTTFQPGNLEVFQRNYYFGWGPWKKVPTRDEFEEILPQANANAKNYADSTFIKKGIIIPNGDDLNNYSSSSREGRYYCPSNAGAATILNSPVTLAFSLLIERHAGVVQTLTTYEPNNPQVFKRNYYASTWGPWKKIATSEEVEKVTDAAVAPIINAENSNGILNSAANQGLTCWKNIGTVLWDTSGFTPINRGFNYFFVGGAVSTNGNATLEAVDQVLVSSGPYNLQAVFNTSGMATTGQLKIEIINTSSGLPIGTLEANPNATWHRKSTTITIPAGVLSVKIRLVVYGGSTGVGATIKGITRIKFSAGVGDVPYTDESDSLSVLQYTNKMRSWGAL